MRLHGGLLKRWITYGGLLAFAGAVATGAWLAWRDEGGDFMVFGHRRDLPTLTVYVAPSATTPQMPFWAAVRDGDLAPVCNLRVGLWKGADELQALVLAAKGDLWLGHLEGFARAKARGAPVSLLAVTGWRKFYLLSRDPACRRFEDLAGKDLPFTPPGTPAVPLLKALLGPGADRIRLVPTEPKQLALLLLRGTFTSVLAPEPQVTVLLSRMPDLKVVANLETAIGERTGGKPRLPLAGFAVNTRTAERYPEAVAALLDILVRKGRALADNPAPGVASLPERFAEFVPRPMVAASLRRDAVCVERATDVRDEIAAYFRIVDPLLLAADGTLAAGEGFLWSRPGPGGTR